MRRRSLHLLESPRLAGTLTAMWLVIIFLLSAWPRPWVPSQGPPGIWPTAGHFLMYAVLAELLSWVGFTMRRLERREFLMLVLAFVLATLYGAAMELYQATVPARSASLGDEVVNAFGAAFGSGLAPAVKKVLNLRVDDPIQFRSTTSS